jgi:hypothetical protein
MSSMPIRAVLLLALLCLPDIGYGDTDWKTYAGTSCQAGHRRESVDYDAFGGICNTSRDRNVVVHCPVVRDYSQSRFLINIRHAGRSGNPDAALRCTLRNMRHGAVNSGSAMQAHAVNLEPIPFVNTTTIRTRDTDLRNAAIDAEDWGAHVLTCDLPASKFELDGQQVLSCLYNYSIREWDGQ